MLLWFPSHIRLVDHSWCVYWTCIEASISLRRKINFPADRRFMNIRLVRLRTSKRNVATHTQLVKSCLDINVQIHIFHFIFFLATFGLQLTQLRVPDTLWYAIKLNMLNIVTLFHSFNFSFCLLLDRPHFNKSASSNAVVKSWIGQVTTMKCAVNANPLAKITWFKDGQVILDGVNSTNEISTLTLAPKTVNDFGLYSCNATNSKGTVWYHITMEQLRKYLSIIFLQ